MITPKEENSPLVSIITPVLNCSEYVQQCIDSVLSQNYTNIEHILIDGGSTDGTLDIIRKYNDNYPDKVIFSVGDDSGACDAWNKGWDLSRGEIIGWLGADDFYASAALGHVVEFFRLNPDAYFVYGKCLTIDNKGQRIAVMGQTNIDIDRALHRGINPIPATSAFYKREVIEQIGKLRTDINICDFDYWIRVGKRYKLYHLDEVLSSFRIHRGSTTGCANYYKRYAKERLLLMKEHGKGFSLMWLAGYVLSYIVVLLRDQFGDSSIVYSMVYLIKRIVTKI